MHVSDHFADPDVILTVVMTIHFYPGQIITYHKKIKRNQSEQARNHMADCSRYIKMHFF